MKDQLEALILQMYKSNILYSEGVREFKKRFILTVLQENKGNQCRAARELGMHRRTAGRVLVCSAAGGAIVPPVRIPLAHWASVPSLRSDAWRVCAGQGALD